MQTQHCPCKIQELNTLLADIGQALLVARSEDKASKLRWVKSMIEDKVNGGDVRPDHH